MNLRVGLESWWSEAVCNPTVIRRLVRCSTAGTLGQETLGDSIPAAVLLHVAASSGSQPSAPSPIREERADRADLLIGRVSDQQVFVIAQRQALGTDGRRNNRNAHGHRLVDLEPRSAPDAQRYHADGGALQIGAHVRNGARHLDSGIARRKGTQARRRRPADHHESCAGYALLDTAEYIGREPTNTVLVRHPVHRADEDQLATLLRSRP